MELPAQRSMDLNRLTHFELAVIPHMAYLMGHAYALTRQRHDAEDLIQETMLKAYASFASFQAGSNVRSWLYRIMSNTWIDNFRRAQRRPTENLQGDLTDTSIGTEQALLRNSEQSAETEAMTRIPGRGESALLSLPDDLRVPVYYADLAGYRNTEIALLLGIPVGTVASRLHRGRNLLRKLLEDCA